MSSRTEYHNLQKKKNPLTRKRFPITCAPTHTWHQHNTCSTVSHCPDRILVKSKVLFNAAISIFQLQTFPTGHIRLRGRIILKPDLYCSTSAKRSMYSSNSVPTFRVSSFVTVNSVSRFSFSVEQRSVQYKIKPNVIGPNPSTISMTARERLHKLTDQHLFHFHTVYTQCMLNLRRLYVTNVSFCQFN
jgi:hypothetical protein